jgi:cyclic di-GMP phosphodiesterase
LDDTQRPRLAHRTGPISLLIVDDEEAIRKSLQRFLRRKGYELTAVGTGGEALRALQRQKIAAVVLDIRLPDGSGVDLVPKLLELEPDVAIVMLTAVNDAASATLSLQRGAMEYLVKPFDLAQLADTLERALRQRDARLESAALNHWLKEEVALRTAELRMERSNLERLSVATLETLVNALEAKDPYLRGHSARVADFAAMVAAELGQPDDQVELVRTAGRLHDIGKIGVREEILGKQGPLTDEEFEHVKQHPGMGAEILAPLAYLGPVIQFVRSHHERWDGKGYPDGIAKEQIPIGARIIGAVEIYDALTTSRPYQEKMPPEMAVERLRDLVGTVLDPGVHRALQAVVARREALVFLDEGRRG